MTRFTSLIPLLAASLAAPLSATELTVVAARGLVGTGDDVMITGFEIKGDEPQKVLIVGVGPSLADAKVTNVLGDPKLVLLQGTQVIASNNDWNGDAEIQATGKAPTKSNEAALIAVLDPGSYTAVLSSQDGSTGNGGVAVYDVKSLTGEGPSIAELMKGNWTGVQTYSINGLQCQWQLNNLTFSPFDSNAPEKGLMHYVRTKTEQDGGISRFDRNCEVNFPKYEQTKGADGEDTTVLTVENLPDRSQDAATPSYEINGNSLSLNNPWPQDFSWPSISTIVVEGNQATIRSTIDANGLYIEFTLNLVRF